jgi:hypothetical protein
MRVARSGVLLPWTPVNLTGGIARKAGSYSPRSVVTKL